MRKKKDFTRKPGFRDSKLIIIATEGEITEYQYFMGLKENIHNSRVHVEILKREDPSKSAPDYVIKTLDEFRKTFNYEKDDEFWLVIDVDRWKEKKISEISQKCIQKNYFFAISNPCFELWLLLHFIKINKNEIANLKSKFKNKQMLTKLLKEKLGSFNNNRLDINNFIDHINNAIIEAEKLDVNPKNRWPQNIGTRVYLLVRRIK